MWKLSFFQECSLLRIVQVLCQAKLLLHTGRVKAWLPGYKGQAEDTINKICNNCCTVVSAAIVVEKIGVLAFCSSHAFTIVCDFIETNARRRWRLLFAQFVNCEASLFNCGNFPQIWVRIPFVAYCVGLLTISSNILLIFLKIFVYTYFWFVHASRNFFLIHTVHFDWICFILSKSLQVNATVKRKFSITNCGELVRRTIKSICQVRSWADLVSRSSIIMTIRNSLLLR